MVKRENERKITWGDSWVGNIKRGKRERSLNNIGCFFFCFASGIPAMWLLSFILVPSLRIGGPDRRWALCRREGQCSCRGEGEQTSPQSGTCGRPIRLRCEAPDGLGPSTGTSLLGIPRRQPSGTAAPNRSLPPTGWTRTRGTRKSSRWRCSEGGRTSRRFSELYRTNQICGTCIWSPWGIPTWQQRTRQLDDDC